MLQVNQLVGFGAFTDSATAAAIPTFHGYDGTPTGTNPYTFTVTLAGDVTNEHGVVGIGLSSNDSKAISVTAVTIDGEACSLVVRQPSDGSTTQELEMWITDNPITVTTSCDVVVTTNVAAFTVASGVGLLTVANLQSTTAEDTAISTTDPLALDVDVSAGGVVIAFGYTGANASATYDWSASDVGITDHGDGFTSGNRTISAGSGAFASSATINVDANPSSSSNPHGVSAAFR